MLLLSFSPVIFSTCRTKALVLELLAAVCLVRGGHEIILSAFDNFKEVIITFTNVTFFYIPFFFKWRLGVQISEQSKALD